MTEGSTPEPQESISAVLADLWTKRRPDVVSDLGALQASVDDAIRFPNDRGHRDRAITIAHRLHGALGVFGFSAHKDRLADIETELRSDSAITGSVTEAVQAVLRELPD